MKTVDEVHDLVRGLSPFPGAFTELNGKMLKIYRTRKEIDNTSNSGQTMLGHEPTGSLQTDGKTFLKFRCSNGYVQVLELQMEGKKRMTVEEFLRGWRG
jgi:methionyl-tRNA formyltransferase